jgi:hypothetical protein
MLLRRVTKHVRDQNWFAVFIDFFIVVFGVYAGFQVTEWSAERNSRDQEATAIDRLVIEYRQNLEILSAVKSKSERVMAATVELLSMIKPAPDPNITDQSISDTLLACMTNPKFVPNLGATKSLLASGDLGLIKSAEIQSRLAQWEAKVQVLVDWQEIERNHGEELILGFTFDYLAWPTINMALGEMAEPSALTSDYAGLFSSKRFEGMLSNRRYNTNRSIERINELETQTDELIELLLARRGEL